MFDLDVDLRALDQVFQNSVHADFLAGTYVVYLAAAPLCQEHQIGADYIADVGKIACRLQVAHADDGFSPAQRDLGNLPAEIRYREPVALAGTHVVNGRAVTISNRSA